MNKIKFLRSKEIKLDRVKYRRYLIGSLPQRFAFIYDDQEEQEGITEWFNYKGFTYVPVQKQTVRVYRVDNLYR